MLRITVSRTNGSPAHDLRLEGQVSGQWVEELRRACEPFLSAPEPRVSQLVLDLSEVSFIDAPGMALIRDCVRRGVVIGPCSPFVREQLREVRDVE